MTYEIRFSELNYGIARVEAKNKEEAEEMALDVYNSGKVIWTDSEICDTDVEEIKRDKLCPGDEVLVLEDGFTAHYGKVMYNFFENSYYPDKDLFLVDYGDERGVGFVNRVQLKKVNHGGEGI